MHYNTILIFTLLFTKIICFSYIDPSKHNLTTPQILIKDGYEVESHYVKTKDGYILNIFRIPYDKKKINKSVSKEIVFLQHGLLASSSTWVINSPGKRLPEMLSDNGYDVWLGNSRGTMYSRNHTSLDPNKNKNFWNFSYTELGVFDISAVIDFILEKTNKTKINYIGHSMGTTMLFVLLSENPSYNNKINSMIALAPVANTTFVKSPLRIFSSALKNNIITNIIANLITSNLGEFKPNDYTKQTAKLNSCFLFLGAYNLCTLGNFIKYGFDYGQVDTKIVYDIAGHYPQGISIYTLIHFAQGINSHKFQKYDYGFKKNIKMYGSVKPPLYNISNINIPIYMFWGENDWLADEKDVKNLYDSFPKGIIKQFNKVNYKNWNHIDFLIAKDANIYINNPILNILKNQI